MKTYTHTFTLHTRDVDLNERWRPGAIFGEMQDVGTIHAEHIGVGRKMTLEQNLVFVLVRSRLEMREYPKMGEEVVSTTWPGKANRFFCPRYHTFTRPDGTLLGCASTLWVLIDVTTRQIVSPLKANLPFPDTSDLLPPCPAPDKAAQLEGVAAVSRAHTSVYTDIDLNGHVNNTRYIDWLCDSLGVDALTNGAITSLVVNYEKEIRPGAALTLSLHREGERFSFLVEAEATHYCEIEGELSPYPSCASRKGCSNAWLGEICSLDDDFFARRGFDVLAREGRRLEDASPAFPCIWQPRLHAF